MTLEELSNVLPNSEHISIANKGQIIFRGDVVDLQSDKIFERLKVSNVTHVCSCPAILDNSLYNVDIPSSYMLIHIKEE